MDDVHEAYNEVYAYTMTRGREPFVLQYAVDAYAAQTCSGDDKPIRLWFALVGLYLHVERQFTGVDVQHVHMRLGQRREDWPQVDLPAARGDVTVFDVLAAPAGPARDAAIDTWCRSVWSAFGGSRQRVIDWLEAREIVDAP